LVHRIYGTPAEQLPQPAPEPADAEPKPADTADEPNEEN
jgi:hypothetical protein